MKICFRCKTEYNDDMAFCSRCGLKLMYKVEEYICPSCGKVLGKELLQFCPYCGKSLKDESWNNYSHNPPSNVNIKKNYVKMQPLNIVNNDNHKANASTLNNRNVNIKKNYVKMQPLTNTNKENQIKTTSDLNKNDKEVKEESSSTWWTIIEIVLLIIGTLFAKSCAQGLLKTQYRGPTAIICLIGTAAFVIYFLYQVFQKFMKPKE